jgi:hypothetical protein
MPLYFSCVQKEEQPAATAQNSSLSQSKEDYEQPDHVVKSMGHIIMHVSTFNQPEKT